MKKNIIVIVSMLSLLLTGCQATSGSSDGFFHTFLINPLIWLLEFNAHLFHGNYGLSIILATLLIRILILPLTMKQYKTQLKMKGKMDNLKPEMAAIQEKIKHTKDPVKKQELQKEMMALYQKHGVNPLNMGCLPMLIQMPILMGFYYAIKASHEIATHSFLWYNLGQADMIMAVIAGVIYYLQFKVSLKQMPTEQQASMKFMGLLSPVMILFVSFSAPAALPLYWSVGGLFMIVQTYTLQKLYKREPKQEVLTSPETLNES
ncbi:OxaA-like protein precursor [Peribacillus loiseleuriae]|uniref:Membrane protein insertase YidC n=2 Tax=Peribacillus loiseleuriae TaxID=1679170 RepID=A0A0K9GRF8_9BACI|nr:membrane protein insertase YidC [Peribacillus loiseleuriae]KMY49181.1 OxaA-like protein precursor [Peribacillus loiseleuriae]